MYVHYFLFKILIFNEPINKYVGIGRTHIGIPIYRLNIYLDAFINGLTYLALVRLRSINDLYVYRD